jgi:hypothetical protein
MDGLSAVQDLVLAPGLALQGMAPGSHLITNDNVVWRRVISSFVRALTRCAPLVAEMLPGAWFYHWSRLPTRSVWMG